MLSRRNKNKKLHILFVVSRNTGFHLGSSINLHELLDKDLVFNFYQI